MTLCCGVTLDTACARAQVGADLAEAGAGHGALRARRGRAARAAAAPVVVRVQPVCAPGAHAQPARSPGQPQGWRCRVTAQRTAPAASAMCRLRLCPLLHASSLRIQLCTSTVSGKAHGAARSARMTWLPALRAMPRHRVARCACAHAVCFGRVRCALRGAQVREALAELELPYELVSCGKGSRHRSAPPPGIYSVLCPGLFLPVAAASRCHMHVTFGHAGALVMCSGGLLCALLLTLAAPRPTRLSATGESSKGLVAASASAQGLGPRPAG
jgi:hypothetical protein